MNWKKNSFWHHYKHRQQLKNISIDVDNTCRISLQISAILRHGVKVLHANVVLLPTSLETFNVSIDLKRGLLFLLMSLTLKGRQGRFVSFGWQQSIVVDAKKVFFLRFWDKNETRDVLYHEKHKTRAFNVLSFVGAINCNTKPKKIMPTRLGFFMPIIKFLGVVANF